MVGSLGALPLAAVSFSSSVFLIMFYFITGLSMSITPLIGEAFVQGKKKIVSSYLMNSLLIFTAISILIMLLQLAITPLLYHLGQPVEVIDNALPYYKYLAWSIIPLIIFCCFERFCLCGYMRGIRRHILYLPDSCLYEHVPFNR